ncbi:unnamed protein product [Danaus chrysippus]|uniref:(African queen) hypothetical protein n=1 Tax=Danaus chrysippus TaxID=151541 RepID=A0A8J2W9U0_9NEOP|nr:unnamed protein product [Danaus chrysippus]
MLTIGKYLKICERNSPDVNDCLVEAIQNGINTMAGGIKDIGVPAVDPFFQKEIRFDYKNNLIKAKMAVKDSWVRGLKDSTVKDVRLRADDDSFYMEVDMFSPAISVDGKYEGGGSYNDLNVTAYGDYVTNMTDLVYTWKLEGKPETIGDDVFVRITSFYMRPDVSNMNVHLSNDSPSSKDLTDLGVKLVNENWRLLYKELLPFAQNNWNKIGIKVANKIFLKVPYNKLFPNN